MAKKYYSLNEALNKIKQYCAYQERCHFEVKNKLYEFGLSADEIDNVIIKLIEENYLNEERFAIHFAGGKFRIKQWGRVKIQYELKQKHIGAILIKKALLQIDEDDYLNVLNKLYQSYIEKQKGVLQTRKLKTLKYLQQKGFEIAVINEVAKSINLK